MQDAECGMKNLLLLVQYPVRTVFNIGRAGRGCMYPDSLRMNMAIYLGRRQPLVLLSELVGYYGRNNSIQFSFLQEAVLMERLIFSFVTCQWPWVCFILLVHRRKLFRTPSPPWARTVRRVYYTTLGHCQASHCERVAPRPSCHCRCRCRSSRTGRTRWYSSPFEGCTI